MFVENVKGFETSSARDDFAAALAQSGYAFTEYLLTPPQFGVPNARLRYYLTAERATADGLGGPAPPALQYAIAGAPGATPAVATVVATAGGGEALVTDTPLTAFLLPPPATAASEALDAQTVCRYAAVMDLVAPAETHSRCFTKGYGYFHEGTGSVLSVLDAAARQAAFAAHAAAPPHDAAACPLAATLGLRLFAPREIANLLCFPPAFAFPPATTVRQQRRLLGNSVNVRVLAALLAARLGTWDGAAAPPPRAPPAEAPAGTAPPPAVGAGAAGAADAEPPAKKPSPPA